MKCFQLPGFLLFISCLFLVSCDAAQHEPAEGFPGDLETARIEGELCLMSCSQDTKNRNLTIGKSNSPAKMGEVPAPATQVYERTFILSPVARNPRLILVGKIRIEACSEINNYNSEMSATKPLTK